MHVHFSEVIFFAIFFFAKLHIAYICSANVQNIFVFVLIFVFYDVGQTRQEIVYLSLNIT